MKNESVFLYVFTCIALLLCGFAGSLAGVSDLQWDPSTKVTVLTPGSEIWESSGLGFPHVQYDSDDGLYKMWYVGWAPGGTNVDDGLGYATSVDGVHWQNRQIVHGPVPGYDNVRGSSVLKEADSYRMWRTDYYENVLGDWSGYVTHATSSDGIHWVDGPSRFSAGGQQATLQGDGYNIHRASVLRDAGGDYRMWYTVWDHAISPPGSVWWHSKIWTARSSDGINWTDRALSLPYVPDTWEDAVLNAEVIVDGSGQYVIFYETLTRPFEIEGIARIGQATSSDGIHWTGRKQTGIEGRAPSYVQGPDGNHYLYFADGPDFWRPSNICRVTTLGTSFCGDGILDAGEECDDGNSVDGDGCSAICVSEIPDTLPELVDVVDGLSGVPQGTKQSLRAKLENAQKSLDGWNVNAASRQLQAFIRQVEALRLKKLTDEQADELIAGAHAIEASFGV